ncbi:MAG: hypothetical protein INQ03_13370 [Candidatus Heimdallarchaeota archaeon]|nr:hypothetical protein [Candidatus Heimdallarchaeota archaeon]
MAPTDYAQQAIDNLRDNSNFTWYIIPILIFVMYIWGKEIRKAQDTGNWNIVFAGLTLFGMDLINETWNSLVFHFTNYAACWMTPGDSVYIIMIGWNIEIAFMFSIAGLVFGNVLPDDKNMKILGLNNRWALSIGFAAFAVFVEVLLNKADALIWEYPFWNFSWGGIWLIFLFGYLHFFIASFLVFDMEQMKNKIMTVGIIYGIGITAVILFMGILKWI